jgi:probable addiction module antidote protein
MDAQLKTMAWEAVDHLDSEEAIMAYLDAAMEDGDPTLIAAALSDIARARARIRLSATAAN